LWEQNRKYPDEIISSKDSVFFDPKDQDTTEKSLVDATPSESEDKAASSSPETPSQESAPIVTEIGQPDSASASPNGD
jgi:cytoskeletal protein RodZ